MLDYAIIQFRYLSVGCLKNSAKFGLASPRPAWPEIVDAADWPRRELGVSEPLWGEACVAMGREQAAIAIAIVSAKPAEHSDQRPAGISTASWQRRGLAT